MVSSPISNVGAALLSLAGLGLVAAPLGAAPPVETFGPMAPPPAGAEPDTTNARIYLSPDGETVYVIGAIMDDSFLRFDALLMGAPKIKTVFLDSPGGLTLEGRLIAALVRKRKLNTYVEHYCASACTQVFAAGRERIIGPEGELGFHQAVGLDADGQMSKLTAATTRLLSPATVFGINGNDTLRLAYEQAGIDEPFIAKALARGHDDMWVPTPAELRQSHVITRQAGRSELLLPLSSLSHAQVRAILETRPMWRAAAAVLPAAFTDGLNDAWRRANSGSTIEAAISSARAVIVLAAWPLLATASNPILDRMLSLYASAARSQRVRGYPLCKESIDDAAAPVDSLDYEFESNEDQLLVELFSSPARMPALKAKDARKTFERDVVPLMASSFMVSEAKSKTASCRLGFNIFQAIDQLPGHKRIKAYRALLTLPDMADGST